MCNLTRIRPLIRRTREAKEGKAGIWGAWVCHLGILLLVVGFAAGQMTHEDYTVTGLPGVSMGCRGDRCCGALGNGEVRYSMTTEDLLIALDGVDRLKSDGIEYPYYPDGVLDLDNL